MQSPSSSRRLRTQFAAAASLRQRLLARHSLRWHGVCIGSFTMVLMWATSHVLMVLGVELLALRYLVTLGVGYGAYLLVLRLWAARLVTPRREGSQWDGAVDLPDVWPSRGTGAGSGPGPTVPRAGGGDFAGAGAEGHFGEGLGDLGAVGDVAGGVAGGALEAAASADEGAVVLVPLVAVFLIGALLLGGAGALAMLYFGWDVLLAVAVELAFSVVTARAAVGMERGGWLGVAVRLTWKPLLGALVCAVALGATIDHFLPGVQSLPQAVRAIQGR